jgi:hypothetical protein
MAFKKIEGKTLTHRDWGLLPSGTVIRFGHGATNLRGKTGVIEKFGRKRYHVNVDGKPWSVPPGMISEIDNDANGRQMRDIAKSETVARASANNLIADDVQVGDIALFFRGQGVYDIGKINRIDARKVSITVLQGRNRNQMYEIKTQYYVCKLPKDRFESHE